MGHGDLVFPVLTRRNLTEAKLELPTTSFPLFHVLAETKVPAETAAGPDVIDK